MNNIFDVIAIIFIIFSAFQGFRSKAGTQFWALVALLAGVVGASLIAPSFSPSLGFLADPKIKGMVAFILAFIIIHQGIQFVARLMNLNFSLGPMDPLAGLVLALIESSLFVGIIGLALMSIPQMRFSIENTVLVYKLAQISKSVIYLLGGKGLF